MSQYLLLKSLHILFVTLSGAGFLLRGTWMLSGNRLLDHRVTRILPHVVDSALLATAVALAMLSHQYPFVAPWLTAKILGLALYVVLGTIALRRGRSRRIRGVAFGLALLTYAWIVSVALNRDPWGFLQL